MLPSTTVAMISSMVTADIVARSCIRLCPGSCPSPMHGMMARPWSIHLRANARHLRSVAYEVGVVVATVTVTAVDAIEVRGPQASAVTPNLAWKVPAAV